MKPAILICTILLFFTAIASCAQHQSETTSDRATETPQIRLTADVRPVIQGLFAAFMSPQKTAPESAGDSESSAAAPNVPDAVPTGAKDLTEDEQFMNAILQIKEREGDLSRAKSEALLGETLLGRVGPVRKDVPESVLELARSENRDREIIFQALARNTNHSSEEIARQYRILMYLEAVEDHLLQDGEGRWVEKNKLDLQN